jgi:hypothetical protein
MAAAFEGRLPDAEDDLRKMYGDEAIFSRVGGFTLVHLDQPSEELVSRRVAEFDPGEFFFDDCPLCQMAMREGGHIVFDGCDGEEPASGAAADAGDGATAAAAFDRALVALGAEAEAFAARFDESVPEGLARRYFEDVDDLSDRLIELLWAEESTRRVEHFDELVARAERAISAVCAAAPRLGEGSFAVRRALAEMAAAWRKL